MHTCAIVHSRSLLALTSCPPACPAPHTHISLASLLYPKCSRSLSKVFFPIQEDRSWCDSAEACRRVSQALVLQMVWRRPQPLPRPLAPSLPPMRDQTPWLMWCVTRHTSIVLIPRPLNGQRVWETGDTPLTEREAYGKLLHSATSPGKVYGRNSDSHCLSVGGCLFTHT